jgi:hypothetical protein
MGAALTYARRYALFTLVGIAGEDDLDAPDLMAPTNQSAGSESTNGAPNGLNGGQHHRAAPATPLPAGKIGRNGTKPNLGSGASAQLREQLLAELTGLGSSDDAATWAHRRMAAKNSLTAADAQGVEAAFQAALARLAASAAHSGDAERAAPTDAIDKSVLALAEPRRVRDRAHRQYVAEQPCLVCGRQPADAHHLRFAQQRALGRKVSDEFTVPLCRGHHREVHRYGDEAAWWRKAGIDPGITARALWLATHPHLAAADDTPALPSKVALPSNVAPPSKATGPSDRATLSSHKQRSAARGPNRKKNRARSIRADGAPRATHN